MGISAKAARTLPRLRINFFRRAAKPNGEAQAPVLNCRLLSPTDRESPKTIRKETMSTPSPHEITQLLRAWSAGDQQALEQLAPLVEAELHRLAQAHLQRERAGHTLQATALVNEAYLRLIEWPGVQFENRVQFFSVAAGLMRRVLVDYARRRNFQKRGGQAFRVSLTEAERQSAAREADLEALNEALERLEQLDPRRSRIVELKYFGGLTVGEIAETLKIAPRTVAREWELARAWLFHQLKG
jgi:RNA polymerase sigma factor (TIGR02999 family)